MSWKLNKGDEWSSETKFSWIDLKDYIEYKITLNLESHAEYELYIDLVEYGCKAKDDHSGTYRKVLKQMRRDFGEEL